MGSVLLGNLLVLAGAVLAVVALLGLLSDCVTLSAACEPGPWYGRSFRLAAGIPAQWTEDSRLLPEMVRAMGISVLIVGLTVLLLLGLALTLGVRAALRPRSPWTNLSAAAVGTVSAVPVLLWATLLAELLFRAQLEMPDVAWTGRGMLFLAAVLSLVLGDGLLSDLTRRVRVQASALLQEPHLRTVVTWKLGRLGHLLRGMVQPLGEVVLSRVVFLVGSSIVVEYIFRLEGLGWKIVVALTPESRNLGQAMVASLLLVALGVALRVALDATAVWADPRRVLREA